MKAYDFEFDGLRLSSMGYMICNFGSDGLNTVSNGSQITFNTVSTNYGAKHILTSTTYEGCIETTFQICKSNCHDDDFIMSIDDVRRLSRWLNRNEFKKFKLINDDIINIYFEASFNISRIESNGNIIGLELNMTTNRPYALIDRKISITNKSHNGKASIRDLSDVEGYIYPNMTVEIKEDGDLSIYNALEDRTMLIKNCKSGEVINIEYPIISTSNDTHKIQDDFNWSFFRIANNFKNYMNNITISIPCKIDITYSPIVKIGI